MPRIPRNYLKTSYFHILVQGINKSYIFNTTEDMKKYKNLIFNYRNEYNINIIAYCIMNNHVHLLVNVLQIENLSSYMHKVNTIYAMYFNKKYKRVGYVFRDRFKSEGIYTQKHLYNCIHYIHNNPVKAGIVKRQIDYKFSSASKLQITQKVKTHPYITFIDVEEDVQKNMEKQIDTFLKQNNLNKQHLLKNRAKLKELLIILNVQNNISFRKIETALDISRETLRMILK